MMRKCSRCGRDFDADVARAFAKMIRPQRKVSWFCPECTEGLRGLFAHRLQSEPGTEPTRSSDV